MSHSSKIMVLSTLIRYYTPFASHLKEMKQCGHTKEVVPHKEYPHITKIPKYTSHLGTPFGIFTGIILTSGRVGVYYLFRCGERERKREQVPQSKGRLEREKKELRANIRLSGSRSRKRNGANGHWIVQARRCGR